MSLFRKWRQQEGNVKERDRAEREERQDIDKAIVKISARLKFLEALTAELIAELPQTKRTRVIENLRGIVREQKIFPPPATVPPGKEQEYHDELRRAVEVLIESNELKLRRP